MTRGGQARTASGYIRKAARVHSCSALLHTRHTASPDSAFPVAHTCFFSLELPAYTSLAICQDKLLYAITECQAIDIDTTTSARENRERAINLDADSDDGQPAGIAEAGA